MSIPTIEYDVEIEIVTINGERMSLEFFRFLSNMQPGTWIRIEQSFVQGKLAIRTVPDSVARTFNAIIGAG